jgi:hypothetical protein
MTPADLATLEAAAKAARHRDGDIRGWGCIVTGDAADLDIGHAYMRAASPDAVLRLVAALRLSENDVLNYQEDRARILAERDELAAEVAAYQGRPEGALPGWEWSEDDGPAWVRPLKCGVMVAHVDGEWLIDWAEVLMEQRSADSHRAAMRAAEAAARARGWLS